MLNCEAKCRGEMGETDEISPGPLGCGDPTPENNDSVYP